MKKTGLLTLTAILTGAGVAHASALVQKDDANGILRLITQINYQGSAVTDAIALASSSEISRMWNESKANVIYQGRNYRTEFVIGYTVNGNLEKINPSSSCGQNTIQVEPLVNPGDRSFYQLNGRTGTFYTSDDLGNSTTTAHEYGHGVGLEHNDGYQLDAEVPGIMFARGTLVQKKFQWNPNAEPGAPGGTLNPKFRHVRAEDILTLDIKNLSFKNNYACLGEGTTAPVVLSNVIKNNNALKVEDKSWKSNFGGLLNYIKPF